MKKTRIFALILSLALVSCTTGTSSESTSSLTSEESTSQESTSEETSYLHATYSNPLKFYKRSLEEYFVTCADPDVIEGDDGYYYLYCTQTNCQMGTDGMGFDRGPIFRSEDMVNWTWVGSVFKDYPDEGKWGTTDAGIWAPSVIKVGDHYNYYYALSTMGDANPGIGVATSTTPYGPWTHYGKLLDSTTSGVKNSIDPQPIYIGEELYLVWGSFYGIAATKLTDDGTEVYYGLDNLKDHVTYLIADNTTDGVMDLEKNYEGTYIIQRDGKYYFFGSQGSCCSGADSTYKVKAGVADNFFGPYYGKDGKDLADLEGSFGDLVIGPSDEVARVGHNSVFQDKEGKYWLLYHGYDVNGSYPNERTLFLDELLWDEDGYPYVKDKVASVGEEKEGPAYVEHLE